MRVSLSDFATRRSMSCVLVHILLWINVCSSNNMACLLVHVLICTVFKFDLRLYVLITRFVDGRGQVRVSLSDFATRRSMSCVLVHILL